jgi:hypothetical protein
MNELIKIKNRYKNKNYNRIPNDNIKNYNINEVVNEVLDDIIVTVIYDNLTTDNLNTFNNTSNNIPNIENQPIELEECRICFEEETAENPFIWPCRCKGTSKYVHRSCIERWRNENVNNQAFEKCMECRYIYRSKYEYPIESFYIEANCVFITFGINIIPLLLTYFITQIDEVNDYTIVKYITGGDNSSIIQIIHSNPQTFSSVTYCIYYNSILFIQCILFVFLYSIYSCRLIKRKKKFLKQHANNMCFHSMFIFKFPILYTLVINDIGWLTIFITLSTICILFESMFYYFFIKIHNNIVDDLNINNTYTLQNYDETDDLLNMTNDYIETLFQSENYTIVPVS